jgi:hypothetical protein
LKNNQSKINGEQVAPGMVLGVLMALSGESLLVA